MLGRREREDPGLGALVRERLAYVLADQAPRRAKPEDVSPLRAAPGSDAGPPYLPSDDDDDPLVEWGVGRPRSGAGFGSRSGIGSLPGSGSQSDVGSVPGSGSQSDVGSVPGSGSQSDVGSGTSSLTRFGSAGSDPGTLSRSGPSPAVGASVVTATGGPGVGSPVSAEDSAPAGPLPRRPFRRTHLAVVAALVVLAFGWAGWLVLRAKPVAMAGGLAPVTSVAPTGGASPASGPGSTRSPDPSSAPSTATLIWVHVLGPVRRPGVTRLPTGSRVTDALAAAGGLRDDADPAQLNLAQVLTDGQQIVIGTRGHPTGEVRDGTSASSDAGSRSGTSAGGAGTVSLNSATQAQLEELPGVGPVTAGKILAWRQQHGRFSRVDELQEVDGIGPKTYAQLAPHVRL